MKRLKMVNKSKSKKGYKFKSTLTSEEKRQQIREKYEGTDTLHMLNFFDALPSDTFRAKNKKARAAAELGFIEFIKACCGKY